MRMKMQYTENPMKATTTRRTKNAGSAHVATQRVTTAVTETVEPRRRQRLNLSIRSDFLKEARAAKLNLSRLLEESLAARLKAERERQWLEENREAIAFHKARIEREGMWNRDLISF